MTLTELASPRYLAGIDAIEAHPAGCRRHPPAKALFVWNHEHLTECLSADDDVFAAMTREQPGPRFTAVWHNELLRNSKVLW